MVDELVLDRPYRRRYTRPTYVKFSPAQREQLEQIAKDRGMSLSQVVRQCAVTNLELPRESQDFDDDDD